jgi:hypothetical protein
MEKYIKDKGSAKGCNFFLNNCIEVDSDSGKSSQGEKCCGRLVLYCATKMENVNHLLLHYLVASEL